MISKNRTKTPYTTILLMIPLSSALFSPSRLLLLHCNHRSGQRTIFSSVRSSYNRGHSVGRFGSSDTRTRHNQHIKVNNKSGFEGIFSSYIHTARTLLFSLMNDKIMASPEEKPNDPISKYNTDHDDDDSVGDDFNIEEQCDPDTDVIPTDSPYRAEYQDLFSKFTAGQTLTSIDDLPKGTPNGCYIIKSGTIPENGFTQSQIDTAISKEDIDRLKLQPDDVTIPAALFLLFPEQFETLTRTRKECRRRKILVRRGPLTCGDEGGEESMFDSEKLEIAKVGDRV